MHEYTSTASVEKEPCAPSTLPMPPRMLSSVTDTRIGARREKSGRKFWTGWKSRSHANLAGVGVVHKAWLHESEATQTRDIKTDLMVSIDDRLFMFALLVR